MKGVDFIHGWRRVQSLRTWNPFLEVIEFIRGRQSHSWRTWNSFMENMEFIHGENGIHSL